MANYKGHIAGGVIITGVYAGIIAFTPIERFVETANVLQNWQAIAAVFVVGILFALFPDVDTNSKAQDVFFGIIFPIDILLLATGYIQAAAYLGLIAMLPILGHHRGWTHELWSMFVIPLPILLLPYLYNDAILPASVIYYGAAVAGYFSHLLLDGLIINNFRIKN